MSVKLQIPEAGESVQEVHIARWYKQEGDEVSEDEIVVELETDKASLDLPSPASGVLAEILKAEGETASVGETIGRIEDNGEKPAAAEEKTRRKKEKRAAGDTEASDEEVAEEESVGEDEEEEAARAERREKAPKGKRKKPSGDEENGKSRREPAAPPSVAVTPSARRELRKHGLQPEDIPVEGKRLRGKDVRRFVKDREEREPVESEERKKRPRPAAEARTAAREEDRAAAAGRRGERLVPLSPVRRRIAQRLVEAQQQAALLTTFNEVDMSAVMALRREHGERFRRRHGVKLGFMSFFVKATVDALREFPELNAEVRGEDAVYRDFVHMGIAVSTDRGLVVPVLRHAEHMSFAEVELAIDDFARRAEEGDLAPDDLQGGTFTISNGGIYGSLLSTPIVNPPQTGVLGMHAIEQRPVGREGQVVLRPMMYLALTYDHRLVDGREAVSCLRRIAEAVESPARLLLDV